MEEILLCKYGEIVLKGLNKSFFEKMMLKTIKMRLKPLGEYNIYSVQSTVYIEPMNGSPVDEALEKVKKVFGIVSVTRAAVCEKSLEDILRVAREYLPEKLRPYRTFKVESKRSDKRFPLTSPQISNEVGGETLSACPFLRVDVHQPDIVVHVEVRERHAYLHAGSEKGACGIPLGSAGRGLLLLSGGIDSPVAGYMMAKRGLFIDAVHFESFPYTSEQAKEKVISLARIMAEYCGKIRLRVISLTKIQEELRDRCDEEYFTLLLRRSMMRLASRVAVNAGSGALITGESLGQVASQTLAAINVTDPAADRPVFRPCIGMDKEEIVTVARKIGTYETSILPYEDCCTVFTPRHPKTRPDLEKVLEQEKKLDLLSLENEAMESLEYLEITAEED